MVERRVRWGDRVYEVSASPRMGTVSVTRSGQHIFFSQGEDTSGIFGNHWEDLSARQLLAILDGTGVLQGRGPSPQAVLRELRGAGRIQRDATDISLGGS